MNRKDYDPMRRWGCTATLLLYLVVFAVAAWLLCGCTRTAYVPVESVRTEWRDRDVERTVTDTVTDTRFVFVKGDTVIDWRERWHRQTEFVHDTVSAMLVDSIPVPYPVERRLTRWEQTKMNFGGVAIGCVVAALCLTVIWIIKATRK